MGDNTNIIWTDATWNPVTGCSPVSPGCTNCYAKTMANRLHAMGQKNYARKFEVTEHPHMLELPFKWKKPRRIFVVSMGDFFHEEVSNKFIAAIFGVMASCPQHTFQILSKRPKRAKEWFDWIGRVDDSYGQIAEDFRVLMSAQSFGVDVDQSIERNWPLPNVWIGTTTENQETADERIPWLLQIPAAVHFVSVEPILGPVDLSKWLPKEATMMFVANEYKDIYPPAGSKIILDGKPNIGWVVAGGEGGPKARPMHPVWARRLRDQCKKANIPFLFKQWGEWVHESQNYGDPTESTASGACYVERDGSVHSARAEARGSAVMVQRVGKKAAGRKLDEVIHDDYPKVKHTT